MMNLNEDLKPIGYYIKDRERMLQEMFRCVRGHKLQAILPDGLKVTWRKFVCFSFEKEKRSMMTRQNKTRDETRSNENLFILTLNFDSLEQVRLIIDPCFR